MTTAAALTAGTMTLTAGTARLLGVEELRRLPGLRWNHPTRSHTDPAGRRVRAPHPGWERSIARSIRSGLSTRRMPSSR